eukprot:9275984-Lingulodinium_polyedra.AAC.1
MSREHMRWAMRQASTSARAKASANACVCRFGKTWRTRCWRARSWCRGVRPPRIAWYLADVALHCARSARLRPFAQRAVSSCGS